MYYDKKPTRRYIRKPEDYFSIQTDRAQGPSVKNQRVPKVTIFSKLPEEKVWKPERRPPSENPNIIVEAKTNPLISKRAVSARRPKPYYDDLQLRDDVDDSGTSKYISIKATNNQSDPYPCVGLRQLSRHRSAKCLLTTKTRVKPKPITNTLIKNRQ